MFSRLGFRPGHLKFALLLLMVALVAQVGLQTGGKNTPPASSQTDGGVPLRMAPYAAPMGDDGAPVAAQAPFEVGSSVKNDVSPPLRDIKPLPAEPWTTPREMTEPKGEDMSRSDPRPPVEDPVVQKEFGPGALAMPAPIQNFAGLGNRNGVYPPDTTGDVGPNHFVQWINLSYQIFNKSGTSVYGPANGNTLWTGFGGACETQNAGDPIVLYDSIANRWLMSQFTAASPYGECIAISTTGDPTGSYYRYFFQHSTTVFYDYPHLGVWPDGYYAAFNRFSGNTYSGPAAIVYDRAKMLNGQPATFQAFNVSSSYGTLQPADLDGPNLPPAGSPNYFISRGSTALNLFKFRVDWTNSANSTFTGPTSLPVAAYNQLCPTTRSCIPQPSTTVKLDGLGDRVLHRLAYRKFSDGRESMVITHGVSASGGQAGVRWYEVRSPNSSPTIHQQGTYAPDATNRWMGSAAMDGSGNIAMVYSASSSSVYPGIRYTGRLSSDPLGQMPQGEATLINGAGSQTGTGSRWGDYAMMTIDPTDDCTFWMTTEYMPTTGNASWATRIGSFKFPGCGSTPPPPTPTNTPTPAPVPTNTPTPAPSTCGERLTNGGFESGTSPWVQTSTNGYQLIDTTRPRTGLYSAFFGGYNSGTDTLYQQVTIPSTATSASLSYWWYMSTQETTHPWDYFYVQVHNSSGGVLATLQTLNDGSTANSWNKSTYSLLAYKGQTVRIYFKSTTDSTLPTSFFLDDVSLNTCQ